MFLKKKIEICLYSLLMDVYHPSMQLSLVFNIKKHQFEK